MLNNDLLCFGAIISHIFRKLDFVYDEYHNQRYDYKFGTSEVSKND